MRFRHSLLPSYAFRADSGNKATRRFDTGLIRDARNGKDVKS